MDLFSFLRVCVCVCLYKNVRAKPNTPADKIDKEEEKINKYLLKIQDAGNKQLFLQYT